MNTISNVDNIIKAKGFIDMEVDDKIDIVNEINKLRKKKNVIILAHYYQEAEIQEIADFVGDSLALSQNAEKTKADIILFAGVNFMAETAKIICPDKKVLLPDLNAGCSLADSCTADEFKKFVENHPGYTVISYINTSTKIKALTDIICTSSNAFQIVNSLPKNKKIIFAPDRNLGDYIKRITGRENMLIWNGACHVHEDFSLEKILELKKENPNAKVIAHPECKKQILLIADHIGSTASLLKFTKEDDSKKYIVVTESGILHQMRKANQDKLFIPAPPIDSTCGCNDCNFMKLITLKKMYLSLLYEKPEIVIDEKIRLQALNPIKRMLEISKTLGL